MEAKQPKIVVRKKETLQQKSEGEWKRVFGFGNKGVRREARLQEVESGGFVHLFEKIGKTRNVRNKIIARRGMGAKEVFF